MHEKEGSGVRAHSSGDVQPAYAYFYAEDMSEINRAHYGILKQACMIPPLLPIPCSGKTTTRRGG
jgi:hypothetical protein